MKKRLLITSIVMMLVVAVALSTATYAWFTSNATVNATSINLTAATNADASIGISWTNGNYGTSISADTTGISALKPTSISTNVADTAWANNLWSSATMYQSNSKSYFNTVTTGADALAYTWHDDSETPNTEFYINNGSSANSITSITMTAQVAQADGATNDASKFIRIAVFKYNTTSSNYELKAILGGAASLVAATGTAQNGVTYYDSTGAIKTTGITVGNDLPAGTFVAGKVALGSAVKDRPVTISDTASGSGTWGSDYCIKNEDIVYEINLGGLTATNGTPTVGSDVMKLKVVVWMDGTALNDDTASANSIASIGLTFKAVQ